MYDMIAVMLSKPINNIPVVLSDIYIGYTQKHWQWIIELLLELEIINICVFFPH